MGFGQAQGKITLDINGTVYYPYHMNDKNCDFCNLKIQNAKSNSRWCGLKCRNRGNQLEYLERLKQRALANPSAFHDPSKTLSEPVEASK